MSDVLIKFKDGTSRDFKHRGRPGGSYTVKVRYEGDFVIVEDEWGTRTAFPGASVVEVVERPTRW